MAEQPVGPEAIAVRRATRDDLSAILTLFDEAVVWLNQRGIEKQWGTEPFSAFARVHEQFLGWIERETLFVACLEDRIVGCVALNTVAPTYVAERWERFPASAFYLEAFTTARALSGQGIGRAILSWAEQYARESGKTTIWLDCWGENAALVRYYERMGFARRDEFWFGTWQGQLFEKSLL